MYIYMYIYLFCVSLSTLIESVSFLPSTTCFRVGSQPLHPLAISPALQKFLKVNVQNCFIKQHEIKKSMFSMGSASLNETSSGHL